MGGKVEGILELEDQRNSSKGKVSKYLLNNTILIERYNIVEVPSLHMYSYYRAYLE